MDLLNTFKIRSTFSLCTTIPLIAEEAKYLHDLHWIEAWNDKYNQYVLKTIGVVSSVYYVLPACAACTSVDKVVEVSSVTSILK